MIDRSCVSTRRRALSVGAGWLALLLALLPMHVIAEGSRLLYPSGYTAARAGMDLTNNNLYVGEVSRTQFLYVYARTGEYILLGSRNRIATAAGGDIRVYFDAGSNYGPKGRENVTGVPVNGSLVFSCDGSGAVTPVNSYYGTTRGEIGTRLQELAGPNSADNTVTVTNGYTPCAYRVPATGVYGVAFSGRTAATANRNVIDPPAILGDGVSAWDVTVRATAQSIVDLNGRLFTYAWAGYTGGNGAAYRVNHTLYYVTTDGYRYKQISRGMDPNGYAMYANRSGFLDNGAPLYKDVRPNGGTPQTVNPILGAAAGIAAEPAQYPVFFSDVGPGTPHVAEVERTLAVLGIPAVPPTPQLSNPDFVGNVGGSTSTVGAGGTFTFDTVNTLSYEIVISRDGTNYDPANPLNRVLTGVAYTGSHLVYWNGKDNAGTNFPVAPTYNYRIAGRNGEVHFPIVDAEANVFGGPTVTKLNGTPGSVVYYDDRGYVSQNGFAVGQLNGHLCGASSTQVQPNAAYSLIGVDSSASTGGVYYRVWSGGNSNTDCAASAGFGDAKGLDTWALELTATIVRNLGIVEPLPGVDVGTSVAVASSAFPTQTVNGNFVFRNDGSSAATGVTYAATIGDPVNNYCPASVSFPLVPSGVTATFNPLPLCTVTFTGMPASLATGQTLLFNFRYPAPAPGTVPVRTEIQAANETAPPGTSPNIANAATIITIADVLTTISVPATAATGSTVNGSLVFGNASAATATAEGIIYAATIGAAGSCPAGVVLTLPTGATYTYDSTNCTVSFSGLPTLLAAGETVNITFSYTAPASAATIPVSSAISTTTPETVTTNNQSSGQTVIADPTAALTIVKTAVEASVIPGGTASYTIVVTNNGPSAAANVVVSDPTPAGLSFVSNTGDCTTAFPCNLGTVPSGVTRTITTTFRLPSNYSGASPITNIASVASPTDPSGPHSDDATTPVGAPVAALTIAKTAVEASVVPGNTASYTIVVTNNGPSDAANVVVSDPTPTGLTFISNAGACTTAFPCNLGTVPSGATRTITTTFRVPSGYSGASPVTNIASVASPTDPSGPHNDDATTPVAAPVAALTIAKTAVEASVVPGNTASYTIVVTNSGPSDAANVVVSDPTPAGLTFISNAGACTTAFPCNLGTVPSGATRTITTTFRVPSGYSGASPITNIASVASPTDPGGPHNDDATTPVTTPLAALTIVKTAVETSVVPGNTASYTIVVTNSGPSDAANVVVSDPTPAGLSFVSNAGACTSAFPCNLGVVPAGATRTITTTFQVPSNYSGTSPIQNIATVVSPTDPSGPHSDDATTPVSAPNAALTVVKTAVEASVVPGNTASYTIVVTNNGPSDAANVVVSDPTPAGLTFVSNAGACTSAFPCNLGTVPNGQTRTITTTFRVPSDYSGASPIRNVAGVVSPTDPSGPHEDDATTPVGAASAALTIVKTAVEASVVPGNTASYTIVVTNNGPSDAANVVVSDPTPVGLTFVSNAGACTTAFPCTLGIVPSGATRTITTIFQVPSNYSGASPIVNIATVTSPTDPSGPHNDNATTPVGTPNAALTIVKTAVEASVVPGNTASYTIVVTNTGPSDAASVVVTDPTPVGLVFVSNAGACTSAFPCNLGVVPAGAARTITTTFRVPSDYSGTAPIRNVASVVSPTDPGGPHEDDATTPVGTPNAALTIIKTAVETSVVPGNTASYTIVVTNNGPSDAVNVMVTDPTPAGLSFVSNAGACTTAFPCNLGVVPAGATRTITTSFRVPSDYTGVSPIINIATVVSPTDPSGPHHDDATTPVASPNAALTIVKTAVETSVVPGNTASYTIVVTNTGPSDAANVVVNDSTPTGLTFVSNAGACTSAFPCSLGIVPAGATRTITTTFRVPSDYSGTAPIRNVASVVSPTDPSGPHEDDATTPIGTPSAALTIVKTAVETSVVPGNTASYTIVVTNTGPSDAANVVVNDPTPTGLTFVSNAGACTSAFPCNLGIVPAGATRTITTTFRVPSDYSGTAPIRNVASVVSPTDPSGPHEDDAITPIGAATAALTIVKTAVEANVVPGNTASYTIVVTNNGPSDAASVVVNDPTPAGLTFVSNAGACTTAFPCNLGTVAAGATRTITTTFRVPSDYSGTTPIRNVASVVSPTDPGGPHEDDATVPVGTPNATLTIVKTAVEANVVPGNTASYTIVVTNNGPSDAASVVVNDPTPAGLAFVSNAGDCTAAFPCNLGTVPGGATRTITTTFQVPSDYSGASLIVNTASVESPTDPTGPHSDDATTPIGTAVAALTIAKMANSSGVSLGGTISYTIVVTNNGPSNATNVVITDPTPAGLWFVGNTGACTTPYPCSIGMIAAGQSRTITSILQVPTTYSGPNPIINIATVVSPTDPDGPHSDDATVPLTPYVEPAKLPVDGRAALLLLLFGILAIAGRSFRQHRAG
jgi:uncharacterized repeat protein (TIGR01451 family)